MKISPGWTSRPTQTSLGRKLLLKIENKILADDNQLMRIKYWKRHCSAEINWLPLGLAGVEN